MNERRDAAMTAAIAPGRAKGGAVHDASLLEVIAL
jgi:hypothetical protein